MAQDFARILSPLGPVVPMDDLDTIWAYVETKVGRVEKDKLVILFNKKQAYSRSHPDVLACMSTFMWDVNVMKWVSQINGFLTEQAQLPSPSFEQGWSVFATVEPAGAADLYRSTEQYSALYALEIGRTIGKKTVVQGRRLRWILGLSMLYQGNKTFWLASPGLEWRLGDVGNSLVSAGCWKLRAQGHYSPGDDLWMADTGLAFETYTFGINVATIGYQTHPRDYYWHSGFFIELVQLNEKLKHKRDKKRAQAH